MRRVARDIACAKLKALAAGAQIVRKALTGKTESEARRPRCIIGEWRRPLPQPKTRREHGAAGLALRVGRR